MKTSRIQILYPERRSVSLDQVQRWAADDLANEEERSPVDWRTIPIEYAIAVVSHHGRPLYVTPNEADDIIAGLRGGDFDLLWNASRRDERLSARKAAKAEALRRKAAEMLGEADTL